jgi:hypothetical protein
MTQLYKYVYVDSGLFYWPGREKEYTGPEETYKEAVRNGNTNILMFERSDAIQATLRCHSGLVRTRFYIISLILSSSNTEIEHAFIKTYCGKLIMDVDYVDGKHFIKNINTIKLFLKFIAHFFNLTFTDIECSHFITFLIQIS